MSKILLIDPNPATRSVLRAHLADAGHHVEGVGGLLAARGALTKFQPDGLVVDVCHPRAEELLLGLEQLHATEGMPIALVALSEDFDSLRRIAPGKNYRILDKSSDEFVLVAQITADLDSEGGHVAWADTKDDDGEEEDEDEGPGSVQDAYTELGVGGQSSERVLLYCDIHRMADVIASLPRPEQTELHNALKAKLDQCVRSHGAIPIMASMHGFSALFDDSPAEVSNCLRTAVEMIYIAQQFSTWVKQRHPGRAMGDFAVSLALDSGDFDDDAGGGEIDAGLKEAITLAAKYAAVGARKGWGITAASSVMRIAEKVCTGGQRTAVRSGVHGTAELHEVAAVAMDAKSGANDRIARSMETNSALLRREAALSPGPSSQGNAPHGKPIDTPPKAAAEQAQPSPTKRTDAKPPSQTDTEGVPDPETGLFVPGYRFERPLGKGGMAEVFLATHIQTGSERVLKMLPINDGEEEQLQRFIQEYALISQIRDPNVARIYEQGFTQSHAYIAMEYLPGGELGVIMKHGFTAEQALECALAIAQALVAVHAKGIAHRDLKPANLMLRADGTLVLADFGIAKGQSDLLNRTASGHIVGSPYYLSPEQAESKPTDARSDLYSLGVMLFEMLTGKKPYRAGNLSDLIRQHVVAPIPRLPVTVAQFQPLIDRLLAKKASDRIPSAELLVTELKSLRNAQGQPPAKAAATTLKHVAAPSPRAPAPAKPKDAYSVAVIGFDETEKIVLSSTLNLSVRRKPRFVEFDVNVNPNDRPDLYLVDARDMLYLQTMLASNLDRAVPTVLIGNSDFGTRWPVLKRPIQWMKIFEAFDRALTQHGHTLASPTP
ncbi:MAG: protein kinase domain-containing protein [Burkholderiales bacterium]